MEQLKKSSFRFPINSNLVIEIAVVFMVIAVVYIVFGYLQGLDMVSDETSDYINDTILQWVVVVGVLMLAIIIAVLFLVINVLRKKK